ncbi:SulP family inorganic anion transporter [Fusibacter sp. JL216-2]|uniref:SulP family inorganic anion transporter n=1 Tax=Fusibacter sp. JL216-2 TaxID=3071453 RepID=UPI003D346407
MSVLKPKLFSTLKGYTRNDFMRDINAGIIVSIIALPLSIAIAIASGVSPEQGLFTAIIGGFFVSLLGGSRVQIGGPTGAFMALVYTIVTKYGYEGLVISTIMAGGIMILFGLLKFGSFIKFIPYPITTGFTSGIAAIIFTAQVKDFLGLEIDKVPAEFVEKWIVYSEHIHSFNPLAIVIGLLSILIIVFWPKVNKKIPGALVAVIVASLLVKFLNLDVATIGSKFGNMSAQLPLPHLPKISFDKLYILMTPAISIAMLGAIESLLSAVVSDGMIGGKHRSNMELIGQGTANIASALFGGIPVTGAIARTAANVKNGGRTPIAGIVHSVCLLLIYVSLMPLAKMIPLSTLAAILMVVSYNMSEWREFKQLLSSPKSDVTVLLITFILTVFWDLIVAIEVGMVLASFLFMKRMSEVSNINISSFDMSEEPDDYQSVPLDDYGSGDVTVYEINGPFFFGAADKFIGALGQVGADTKSLVIRMRNVPAMDATAIQAMRRMVAICKSHHVDLSISEAQDQPRDVLMKSGLYDQIGAEKFYESIDEALKASQKV